MRSALPFGGKFAALTRLSDRLTRLSAGHTLDTSLSAGYCIFRAHTPDCTPIYLLSATAYLPLCPASVFSAAVPYLFSLSLSLPFLCLSSCQCLTISFSISFTSSPPPFPRSPTHLPTQPLPPSFPQVRFRRCPILFLKGTHTFAHTRAHTRAGTHAPRHVPLHTPPCTCPLETPQSLIPASLPLPFIPI